MKIPRLRILLPTIALFLLLSTIALVIGYGKFKISRFTDLGDQAIDNGSWQQAVFWYGRVLEKDPANRYVIRQLSRNSTLFRDPSEVYWWQKRFEIEPESTEVKLALVKALLRADQPDEAKRMLDQFDTPEDQDETYYNLVTAYYLVKGNYREAEIHARETADLYPGSINAKLNLLDTLMRMGSKKSSDEINRLVADISADPSNLPNLSRTLIAYATSVGDWKQAIRHYQTLLQSDEVEWFEQSQYIKLLVRYEPQSIPSALRGFSTVPFILLETVCRELTLNQRAEYALQWLDALEADYDISTLSFQISKAEALANTERWEDLLQYLFGLDWGSFDYYRYALMALACQQTERYLESTRNWKEALKLSYQNIQEQFRLAKTFESWESFQPQWISLLEDMLLHSVHTRWVYHKLHDYYYTKGSTQDLYRISIRALKLLPADHQLQSNVTHYSLLLNLDLTKQLVDARSYFDEVGNTPISITTYAFALYKNRQYEEALEIIRNLSSQDLEIPEIAYYAAIIASSAGSEQETEVYSAKAIDAQLLPEERALLLSFQ